MHPDRRLGRAYAGWALLLLTAAVAAMALLPAGALEDGAQAEALRDPVAFAETSYANNCAQCHGQTGTGAVVPDTDRRAPALVGRDDVTTAYMDLVLRTGRMPPAGDPFDNRAREVFYSEEEREAMVAWTSEEFGLEGDIPEVGEGQVARGLELFALNCAHCHGNTGAGGTAGQAAWTPRVDQLDPLAVVEAIRVGPFEMPAFSDQVLSQEDVNDIAAYLEAVDEESGTPVLGLVELNPVYASGFVGVLALALLGSLLFIGGRPQSFQAVDHEAPPRPLHAARSSDSISMTPDPKASARPPSGEPSQADGDTDAQDDADAQNAGDDPDDPQEQA